MKPITTERIKANTMQSKLHFTEDRIICGEKEYNRSFIETIIREASHFSIKHIVVDGFCGMGGVTAGFSMLKNWKVIACINHWQLAIKTHKTNHPNCLHLLEDFRTADLTIIRYMIAEIKKRNADVKVHLWLSLECTNFSNAKGGKSRDADSRTLADHADRYVIELNPDTIWIENVKEFRLWGPMIPKVIINVGKKKKTLQFNPDLDNEDLFFAPYIADGSAPQCPLIIKKKERIVGPWMIPEDEGKGEDFKRWKKYICSLGYSVDEKLMNCADYGIPQHRVRLIMQFNRKGNSATWPMQTHDKKGRNGLLPWMPVKPCLDLEDEGESVLSFKTQKGKLVPRITSSKTIDRLINGTNKHVLKGDIDTWIVKTNSAKNNTDVSSGASVENPSPTLTCFGGLNIAKAHLIDHYFGNGYMKSVDEPAGTTGTKDGIAMHTIQHLSTYHSRGDGSSLNQPAPAVMTKDKHPLVTTKFLMDTAYNNGSTELQETIGTITANRKYYYLVNFQWFSEGLNSVTNPSNTLIARQDKSPDYLVTLETGELAIEVFDHDPEHYRKLKKYMAENGIISINMRMLKEVEMLRIMTIPEKTRLSKSSTANKKMIGNAVPSELIMHLGKAYEGNDATIQQVA